MKNKILKSIVALSGAIFLIGSISGCKDMFVDPTKDKTTGETVTLLLIDRNFIKTKFYVHVVDYTTNQEITSEPINVYFVGGDSANLVSFGGEKMAKYSTSSGFIEVGYDPNIPVSAAEPIEFRVVAMGDHYVSVPQSFRYTTEGVKDLIIRCVRVGAGTPELKSSFDEPFDLKFNNELKSSNLLYQRTFMTPDNAGNLIWNLYKSGISGTVTASNLKDNIKYSDYGIEALWQIPSFNYLFRYNPMYKDFSVPGGAFIYTMVKQTGLELCNSGLTIHVGGPEGGSGTFNYVIGFSDGSTQEGMISCVFPCDKVIEPIYYPSADESVTVTLLGDAQYGMSDQVSLSSACGSTAGFTATPLSNLLKYKLITKYTCAENPVGFALSIQGQFRLTGTSDTWTSFAFTGGVCELRLDPGKDYDFRVNIDGEWHLFTLPTDPTKIEDALRNNQSVDYKLTSITITTTDLQITVDAVVQFSSGVCDMIK